MKKFSILLFIFIFFTFTFNINIAFSDTKSFTQGLYNFTDTGLVTGSSYNIKNSSSTGRAVVIIFDSNQMMQEFIRLEPNSPNYILKPLDYGYIIIIIGGGSVEFY
ncbi:hypothetical protein [Clostridium saccharoperbutylacetonicum]|uniref:Uncharacterized protein n=1 Tax=Clostridium saccharoperbutylacetonicum N1-4(HMT) TaxID=931276 RepID=M1N2B9_9CLOT|nr:hypothetical protein [Clostridium saccharoperbutylacetonicum]AGF57622.1 hypothetical protein Cspa_c38620 [Clostridium saccharoperbutylacetonicum N1-4(HMT)]AQR96315.1 hypothetical protein CLSAP_36360 [Clostridium saccharoperbutylacetonicum]NRT61610.1 hypothetical protein [Clostridium saccharoperbutylacetonicum]NSB24933.1 hypothetical protein [Clostridium saccharoperbutylacetonicum]NSB32188.1 hypothetical protein [Clostridium saccharoperbutylacetonicum]